MKLVKLLFISMVSGLFSCGGSAEPTGDTKVEKKYVEEAPLPKGWPMPGPYDEVTEKNFPAYRAAYTSGKGQTFAFWRLFNHIKRHEIPMTSPVEMGMEKMGESLRMKSMGFMYQDTAVGKLGKDGEKVEVKDVPEMRTLSYTWQGPKSVKNLEKAKGALDAELKRRGLVSEDYRVMGYNGPGVIEAKKTWEMVVVLSGK